MIFLREQKNCITLTLHVQPRASRTEIRGVHGDALKILLKAPPVDGEANMAVIEFFADFFEKSKNMIQIKSGETSRRKVIEIKDVPLAIAKEKIQKALA